MLRESMDERQLIDKVVFINRVAKVVKGGRRFSFSAIVVVGDVNGKVGFGSGKAQEVPEAIRKGIEAAKKAMIDIPLIEGTIPFIMEGRFGATKVFMRPAREGTGVIAGGAVRAVMEAAGVENILTKCYGSRNPHNMVRAVFEAFTRMMSPAEITARRGRLKKGDEAEEDGQSA